MHKIYLHKDPAFKYHLGLWILILIIYYLSLTTNNQYSGYIFTAVIGSSYYLFARVFFGKSKIWQTFLSALFIVISVECLAPLLIDNINTIPLLDILEHVPVLVVMLFIDFTAEESFDIIEEIEEKIEKST